MRKIVLILLFYVVHNVIYSQSMVMQKKVNIIVNEKGDTLLTMNYKYGRILLEDLSNCKITDTILEQYKDKDVLNQQKIVLLNQQIDKRDTIIGNKDVIIKNLNSVIDNKDGIIILKDDEIKYQKHLKRLGFLGCVILPIITIFILK